MTELINTRMGDCYLTTIIGRGRMSTTYKAYQPSLERFVAVKALPYTTDPHFLARFKREALALTRLQHPHILPVYGFGEQDGRPYLVSQYVESSASLSDWRGRRMEVVAGLQLTTRLLNALDYAHACGIIHCDITPANVLLPAPALPLLADFALARLISSGRHSISAATPSGTTTYRAPEQASGGVFDARADLYAIGVILYELLTGRVPFATDMPAAILWKQTDEPPPPRSLNPNIPAKVEVALLRALMRDPDARYQSATEMAQALEHVAAQIELPLLPSAITGALLHPEDTHAELYQAGLQAFRSGRWDIAIDRINRLIALDPTNADALRLLDQIHTAQAYVQQAALRGTRATPSQSTPNEHATRRLTTCECPRCARETQPEWIICPYCHTPLAPDHHSARAAHGQQNSPTQYRYRILQILLILAAIGGAVGFGILQWCAATVQQPTVPPAVTSVDAEDHPTPTTTLAPDPATVKSMPTSRPTRALDSVLATPLKNPLATRLPTPTST